MHLGVVHLCSTKQTVVAPAFTDVDKAVFPWFTEQRANKVPLSIKVLQQKALEFACLLGHENFRASAGWLNRFEARHDIVAKVISRESASIDSVRNVILVAVYTRDKRPIQA